MDNKKGSQSSFILYCLLIKLTPTILCESSGPLKTEIRGGKGASGLSRG